MLTNLTLRIFAGSVIMRYGGVLYNVCASVCCVGLFISVVKMKA